MASLANFDRIFGQVNAKYFEGVSVRRFDPATRDWTIYWIDIRYPQLNEEVRAALRATAQRLCRRISKLDSSGGD